MGVKIIMPTSKDDDFISIEGISIDSVNSASERIQDIIDELHATVMNTGHSERTKWKRKVYSFDARGIFEQYGSEDWGQYLIHEAHLSQIFSFDENGYYHCCASIPFPGNVQVE
ncbi:hypothetical protein LR48_Vigan05g210400 [Vigna angularis]|uniref:A-kinase anchor protein 7-like phosphoesterase domain-containing protein n=1 Tax=Phaseolus angularis TaxID=3914 RepID=A0A0L9UPQ2_PHAAN|nr:hypothetical protein LR48_Vigan05g210400 [Vigna angularis]